MSIDLKELAERIARLEAWANAFSCRVEHSDAPIFVTKADEDAINLRSATLSDSSAK